MWLSREKLGSLVLSSYRKSLIFSAIESYTMVDYVHFEVPAVNL
jgi:hypothetical protein